jgi:hypothetical protein
MPVPVNPFPGPNDPSYVSQPGVASGNNTPTTKRCGCKHPTKHPQGLALPISEFFKNKITKDGLSPICKQCDYDAKRRMKQRSIGEDTKETEGAVDPKFILNEAITLYGETTRIEQKIKLLELMAKYSPEMKNAKPQDKVALMASLMESLKKEKATDAIAKVGDVAE